MANSHIGNMPAVRTARPGATLASVHASRASKDAKQDPEMALFHAARDVGMRHQTIKKARQQ